MKNVKQLSFADSELARLKPQTVAAMKVLARDHWKLFQVENVLVYSTRKDFMRRRLDRIEDLDKVLNPGALIFPRLSAFEKHIKALVKEWYKWRSWEMFEPYEDFLQGRNPF